MPIYAEIEGGQRLEFPDGTDPAVIQATVKRVIAGQYQTPSQRRGQEGPDASMRGYNPPARNALSSLAHGGLDASEGLAQIVSRAATAMGMPPGSDYPFVASPEIVEQRTNEARSAVEKRLGTPNPQGMDFIRAGGSSALTAPLMGPVGTAGTMAGRAGQAARAGAIQGAAQPVQDAKSNYDFLGQKMFQAGTGAVVGGAAHPGLELGAQAATSAARFLTNRARGAVQDTSENAAALIASQTLAQQGVKWNDLSQQVQQSLVKDVQEALKKYGGVNAAALGRQADFKALDIDPLQPWVTRDPVEWGKYKNLEGSRDAGEPLIRARADLDRKLMARLEGLRGPNVGDPYQSGEMAGRAISRKLDASKGAIDAHYAKFRELAPNVSADGKRMTDGLFRELDEAMVGKFLSPELRDTLNDMALGKIPANPTVLHQLQKIASTEARKGGNGGLAAGKVVGAIEREMDQFADELSIVGPEMKDAVAALKAGRAAHRKLKMDEEAVPALKAVAEGKYAAEDFFNSYILGADVKDVAAMWMKIPSVEVKAAARSQMVDYLKKKAAGSGAEDAAVFRQGNFTEALGNPGMNQKIKIILGEKGLAEIQRVQRAAEAAIRTPAGTRYNTSGTAAELMNLARKGGGLPVIGPQIADPLMRGFSQAQATGMTQPASLGMSAMDPFLEEILRRARQGSVGFLAPAAGGLMASEFSK